MQNKKDRGAGGRLGLLLALWFAQTGPKADPDMEIRHHQFLFGLIACNM
ncbi:MAG: hypothetical protein KGY56_02495 [Desulfobacterales bacterium]|nr:hypothetical protein [Desulfobacterales bacterium]